MTAMPTEQLVVATGKPKIGSRPAPSPAPTEVEKAPKEKKKKGKRLILIVLVLVLVGGGAGYWFLLKPSGAEPAAEAVEAPPEPGAVVVIEPISLNLADGHYLRLGLGLQLTAEVAEEPDTARALDQAVSLFSGRSVAEVASTEGREALRVELIALLDEAYEGEVMDVYFTDYVTQ
jgi:flagellar FliL protein